MKKYIGCDMHKKYSVFVTMDEHGHLSEPRKVANDSLELDSYLKTVEEATPVAVEASGSWYWFVDRLEQAGLDVRLVNPLEAKKRMAGRHKTDPRDAAGLAMLLRNGTLPCMAQSGATDRGNREKPRTCLRGKAEYNCRCMWGPCHQKHGLRRAMSGSSSTKSSSISKNWRSAFGWASANSATCAYCDRCRA